MDKICINIDREEDIDLCTLKKITFISNALDDGWSIHKNNNKYIFTKKHEGKKEVLSDDYLKNFIEQHMFKKI
jgi:hypothetical protein